MRMKIFSHALSDDELIEKFRLQRLLYCHSFQTLIIELVDYGETYGVLAATELEKLLEHMFAEKEPKQAISV
jgi:hypothetical protein